MNYLLKYFAAIVLFLIVGCKEQTDKNEAGKEIPAIETSEENIIKLTEQQSLQLKIKTVKVSGENLNIPISVPAFVYPAPSHYIVVSSPVNGRVVNIAAHEGELIKKGDLLVEIESLQFGNLVAEYLNAKAEEEYQKGKLKRIESLVEKKISTQSELDKISSDYSRAKTASSAAYAKLKAVGIKDSELKSLSASNEINAKLKIYSEIEGIVDQHLIEMGQAVSENEKMATIINPKKVLVKGFVNPNNSSSLVKGNRLIVYQNENPDKKIDGVITSINPALDELNKSIVVNSIISSENNWPKPGENLRMEIITSAGQNEIIIPTNAVAYENEDAIVFIKIDEFSFEKRIINVKNIISEKMIIESGLQLGDEIAVSEIFTLKALFRYDEFAEE